MRGGALPPGLLCAAVGLALAFAATRVQRTSLALLAIVAAAASFARTPAAWQDGIFLGGWISIALGAAAVHLPKGLGPRAASLMAINAGLWTGLLVASAAKRSDLFKALPCALVCLPATWLVARGWGVAVKVAASWLIAVAILAAGLQMVPTPGYKPDHMD